MRLRDLKKKYEIGTSPLREALNRLTAIGIVSQEKNRGFRVSTASLEELQDIVDTRCLLEEVALRQSINNNDHDYYERIVLINYRLAQFAKNQNNSCCVADREKLHLEFHQTILSGCRSSILVKFCLSLYEHTQRYRNLAINQKCREDHQECDHQAICDAILDRDADRAIELLRSHYQTTKDFIVKNQLP